MATPEGAAPLFLLGAPRSGTSLLYKALCLHPAVAYISNWVGRWPGLPQLAVLNRLARRRPDLQRRVWFGGGDEAYVYGRRRAWWERAFPMPVEGEPVYVRCGFTEAGSGAVGPDARPRPALRASFSTIRRFGGGRVLVSKRIANNRRVPALLATFPEARFVEILRDGRAVACSLSRVDWWPDSVLWWLGRTPRQWEAGGGDPWELCARSWVEELDALRQGLAEVPDGQVRSLSYEAFLEGPLETLSEVAAFAGLDPADPGWTSRVGALDFPDRNQAWRQLMPTEAVATVERVQASALHRHGYG